MIGLFSALAAPATMPSPRAVAQVPTDSGTRLPVARAPARANDSFSVAVGTNQAANISALTGANRNAGEAASLLRVADAGLDEINDALTRMKELATEASTTSPSRRDRAIMNAEFETLRAEIDSIAERTEFNDV